MVVGLCKQSEPAVRHQSQGGVLVSGAVHGGAGGGRGGGADPGGPLEEGTGARHNLQIDPLIL